VTRDELMARCLEKPGAWADEPWEGDVVAKVGSKIFAFLGTGAADGQAQAGETPAGGAPSGEPATIGLKCAATREAADEWLLRYPGDVSVMPYIGRFGWNSLRTGGVIPDGELLEALDASYRAVLSKLPRKDRPADPAAP
jgi:predicted DNA-binding protein (MmcQ/YjbR family)